MYPIYCENCLNRSRSLDQQECSYCGYPKQGSEQQITIYKRKIRNANYAHEDYKVAIDKLKQPGFTYITLGVMWLISNLAFGADNYSATFFSILVGGAFYRIQKALDWRKAINSLAAFGVFAIILILEFIIFGLPDPIFPTMEIFNEGGRISLIRMVNNLTPFLYWALKTFFLYPFLLIYSKRKKYDEMPDIYKKRIIDRKTKILL